MFISYIVSYCMNHNIFITIYVYLDAFWGSPTLCLFGSNDQKEKPLDRNKSKGG